MSKPIIDGPEIPDDTLDNLAHRRDIQATEPIIALVGSFGQYSMRAEAFDIMIQKYLPASLAGLRKILDARGAEDTDRIQSVTHALMVLGEYDAYGL